VVDAQPTPNPNATKYMLDRPVVEAPTSFFDAVSAKGHPLASKLFEIRGVTSVLLLGDFVTVNKAPDVRWADINRRVEKVLWEAY
jgi:hypothetical protein